MCVCVCVCVSVYVYVCVLVCVSHEHQAVQMETIVRGLELVRQALSGSSCSSSTVASTTTTTTQQPPTSAHNSPSTSYQSNTLQNDISKCVVNPTVKNVAQQYAKLADTIITNRGSEHHGLLQRVLRDVIGEIIKGKLGTEDQHHEHQTNTVTGTMTAATTIIGTTTITSAPPLSLPPPLPPPPPPLPRIFASPTSP